MNPKVVQYSIDAEIDDHIFIMVKRKDRPTISIDIMNCHGRATLSVRSDGMGIGSILCDVAPLKPASGKILTRYCPMCGEKLDNFSSAPHQCKDSEERYGAQ